MNSENTRKQNREQIDSASKIQILKIFKPGFCAQKTYRKTEGGWEVESTYLAGKHFRTYEEDVSSAQDFYKLLLQMDKDPKAFIIRGTIRPNVNPSFVNRRTRDKQKDGEKPSFTECDREYILLDFDKIPREETRELKLDDPSSCKRWILAFIQDALPNWLKKTSCIARFSSSTGTTGFGLHIWFLLDRGVCCESLKDYFKKQNEGIKQSFEVDLSLFTAVQPHYTANPAMLNSSDPVKVRTYFLEQDQDRANPPTELLCLKEHLKKKSKEEKQRKEKKDRGEREQKQRSKLLDLPENTRKSPLELGSPLLEKLVEFVESCHEGNARYAELRSKIFKGASWVNAGFLDRETFRREILYAGLRSGRNERELTSLIDGAIFRASPAEPPIIPIPQAETQYLPPIKIRDGIRLLCIKASLGSGKTEQVSRLVKNLTSAVIFTPLRTLTRAAQKRFGEDFLHYQDDLPGGPINESKLVCTINSVERVANGIRQKRKMEGYDLVFLDEAGACLDVVSGITTLKDLSVARAFSGLQTVLDTSKTIILADANLTKATVDSFAQMMEIDEDQIQYIQHERTPQRTFVMAEQKAQVENELFDCLAKGKKLAIACTWAKDVKALSKQIKSRFPDLKILTIYGDEKSSKETLADVNKSWSEYSVVIYSPACASGVSFDLEGHFDHICLIAEPVEGLGAPDLQQMIWRVRKPKSETIFAYINSRCLSEESRPICPKQIKEELLHFKTYTEHVLIRSKRVNGKSVGHPVDPLHLDVWSRLKAVSNIRRQNVRRDFVRFFKERGCTFKKARKISKKKKELMNKERSQVKAKLKEEEYEKILTSPEMGEEQAQLVLENLHEASEEQKSSAKKVRLEEYYGKPLDIELLRRDKDGRQRRTITRLIRTSHFAQGHRELFENEDLREWKDGDFLTALSTYTTIHAKAVNDMLDCVFKHIPSLQPTVLTFSLRGSKPKGWSRSADIYNPQHPTWTKPLNCSAPDIFISEYKALLEDSTRNALLREVGFPRDIASSETCLGKVLNWLGFKRRSVRPRGKDGSRSRSYFLCYTSFVQLLCDSENVRAKYSERIARADEERLLRENFYAQTTESSALKLYSQERKGIGPCGNEEKVLNIFTRLSQGLWGETLKEVLDSLKPPRYSVKIQRSISKWFNEFGGYISPTEVEFLFAHKSQLSSYMRNHLASDLERSPTT